MLEQWQSVVNTSKNRRKRVKHFLRSWQRVSFITLRGHKMSQQQTRGQPYDSLLSCLHATHFRTFERILCICAGSHLDVAHSQKKKNTICNIWNLAIAFTLRQGPCKLIFAVWRKTSLTSFYHSRIPWPLTQCVCSRHAHILTFDKRQKYKPDVSMSDEALLMTLDGDERGNSFPMIPR